MDHNTAASTFPPAPHKRLRVAAALVVLLCMAVATPERAFAASIASASSAPATGSAATSAAPASGPATTTATQAADEDVPRWITPAFWKATAGAAIGGAIGAKLLGWGPMLSGLSQIAKLSPFAALVARPVLPVLMGAIGAQVASSNLAHADWSMIGAQTIGGALGTAAALLVAPGAGSIGPWIGQIVGVYAGTWLLKQWRTHHAETAEGTAVDAGSIASASAAPAHVDPAVNAAASLAATHTQSAGARVAPAVNVPVIHGASGSDIAVAAYERWRSAKDAGSETAARTAYSGVVSALSH